MFKRNSIFPALALAALTLFVAGCGGSDDPITMAEFINRADAICKKADETKNKEFKIYALKNAQSLNDLPFGKAEAKIATDVYLPSIQGLVQKLEALDVPADNEAKIQNFFREMEAAYRKAEKSPDHLYNPVNTRPFSGVSSLARKYGFKDCAEIA